MKISPSSCSPQFIPRTLIKTHHSPLPFIPPNPNKLSFKFLCSCHSSKDGNPSPSQDFTLLSLLLAIPNWADSIKERGMKQKRSLYDHKNWVHHRSSLRHVRHFLSSLSSRVILSLVPPVIVFTSVAVIIASYNSAVSMHWLPEFFPILRASTLPYQLTAPALALLLVFRTEASYSRFEEGKKAWTKVISGTNDFARQVIASVECPSDSMLKKTILQYIMAFPIALKFMLNVLNCAYDAYLHVVKLGFWPLPASLVLDISFCFLVAFFSLKFKCHIIHGSDIAQDLKNLLEPDDLSVVLSSKHRPGCIIEFISQSLQLLDMEAAKRHVLESKLCCFHEGIGVCEQLMGTPIPLSYTRLTSRFLVLWHFTLPIILWDDCHWIVVPATFISAASLFCIEEVGVLIEEPFPMLALDELCFRVQSNIQDIMRNEKLIKDQVTKAKRKNHPTNHSSNGWPNSLEDRQPT